MDVIWEMSNGKWINLTEVWFFLMGDDLGRVGDREDDESCKILQKMYSKVNRRMMMCVLWNINRFVSTRTIKKGAGWEVDKEKDDNIEYFGGC